MDTENAKTLAQLGAALEQLRNQHAHYLAQAQWLASPIEAIERALAELKGVPGWDTLGVPKCAPSGDASRSNSTSTTSADESWPVLSEPSAATVPVPEAVDWRRQLRGRTQYEALLEIARRNGGLIRVGPARDIFLAIGITKSKRDDAYSTIHGLLKNSEEFEQVGPGEFRLKSETSGGLGLAAGPDRIATDHAATREEDADQAARAAPEANDAAPSDRADEDE